VPWRQIKGDWPKTILSFVIKILLKIAQDNLVVIPHSNEDILSFVMLSVTMLIVVLLSVVAPNKRRLA
jgi:hypothetical protein